MNINYFLVKIAHKVFEKCIKKSLFSFLDWYTDVYLFIERIRGVDKSSELFIKTLNLFSARLSFINVPRDCFI